MPSELIDEGCRRRFEQQRRSNPAASPADFLPAADDPAYLATLEELVLIDLEFGWKEACPGTSGPLVDDYMRRFPRLAERQIAFRLLRQEYELRLARGETAVLDDYRRRFPEWLAVGFEFLDERATAADPSAPSDVVPTDVGTQVVQPTEAGGPDDPATVWKRAIRNVDSPGRSSLADALVTQGKLTRFQSQRLLAGRGDSLVLGEYVLLDEIGAGGMGCVYKAEHRRMKRIVALKTISPAGLRDDQAVRRFEREVHAVAKLEHPNIVTAHDAGRAGDMHFLVMQFVEGRDLASHVCLHGPLAFADALNYVLQAARGLAFAHAAGVIHRDIKPANLLLDKNGVVKILDLGLARLEHGAEPLTSAETMMGTVDFMSPEQAANSKAAGAPSDVYSLGCTLWFLLTARRLYDGDAAVERLLAHRDAPIPSLAAVRPDAPAEVDDLVRRLVAKSPGERSTIHELIQVLERLADPNDESPQVRRPARSRANRKKPGLVVAVLVAAALSASLAYWSTRPDKAASDAADQEQLAADRERLEADRARHSAIDLSLAGIAGIDADVAAVQALEKSYRDAVGSLFGANAETVRDDAVKILNRLQTYELTDAERKLADETAAQASKVAFYPEEIYPAVRKLAEMVAGRKRTLLAERELLTNRLNAGR